MNPLQMLVRLKQIEADAQAISRAAGTVNVQRLADLERERRGILAEVGGPPVSILGVADAAIWAEAFASTYPRHSAANIFPWFLNAMSAAEHAGRSQARQSPGFDELVLAARVSLNVLGERAGQSFKVADDLRTHREILQTALLAAGIDP